MMRIKYGSSKAKQNYQSSRMGNMFGGGPSYGISSAGLKSSVQTQNESSKTRNNRPTSQGSDYKKLNTIGGSSSAMNRQRSTSSVNSNDPSSRLMTGTVSSNQKNLQLQNKARKTVGTTAGQGLSSAYSRQMSSLRNQINFGPGTETNRTNQSRQRSTSVNSSNSIGQRFTKQNSIISSRIQNSDQKSLVRVALKN